ncbi:hypothetical protein NEOLEDRAFT_1037876, partial [Neolentinus lepideus HHB14362 ss-1]
MKAFFVSVALSTDSSFTPTRTFTVYNCSLFAIWPSMFTDFNSGSAVPDYATGYAALP